MSWAATAEPVAMLVGCDRQRHRLRWEAGQVVTVDHPELEAELALVALGGEEPRCVALHRLWHEAIDDGGFVAEWVDPTHLNPTWLSWLGMALERMRTEGFHEFLRHLPPARARRMGEFLHAFPLAWIDRAAAEVNRRAVDDGTAPPAEHLAPLRQAAANRLRRSFVDAVGGRQLAIGTAALIPLVPIIDPDPTARPAIAGRLTGPERGLTVVTGPAWLHRVWAAGAAVVDGHLVLDLDPVTGWAAVVAWPEGAGGPPLLDDRRLVHRTGAWTLV